MLQWFERTITSLSSKDNKVIRLPEIHKILIAKYFRWQIFRNKSRRVASKSRSFIKCSTAKLRSQKGTGHSRLGDASSPMLRKGATAHGPKATLKRIKLNKKERFIAKFSCLKSVLDKIFWVDKLPLDSKRIIDLKKYQNKNWNLIITSAVMDKRSWRNLKNVKVIPYSALNVKDLLKAKRIIIDEDSIKNFNSEIELKIPLNNISNEDLSK